MALHSFSTKPLYLQLYDALAERIATGLWKPGISIPNEIDLAREFGVSAGTMRKALSLMEDQQLITRRQGRGTYVNDPASDKFVKRFSNVYGADGQPLTGRVETANLTEGKATEAECLRLQLRSQDPVWRIRRTRFDKEQAFMHEEVCLPAELFPNMNDGSSDRLAVLAQQHGLLLGKAQERIAIGAASGEAAEVFDIAQGSPIIVLDRVVRTITGRPAEWRVGQCRLSASYYLVHIG
jgi:GntR family transcriptional regulator